MMQVTGKNVYDGFVEIGTASKDGGGDKGEWIQGFLSIKTFIEVLVEGKHRVRYMKHSCAAYHWGNIHKATSQEILRGDLDLAVFVGPVERVGGKKMREYLMPCSCIAHDEEEAVPGEILDAGELSERGFFALWTKFQDELKKAIPGFTFVGQFQSRRNKEDKEDRTCMICLDEPATFAWQGCYHNRPTICEVCKDASEKPLKKKIVPPQCIQTPCCYCRTISSIIGWNSPPSLQNPLEKKEAIISPMKRESGYLAPRPSGHIYLAPRPPGFTL